MVDNPRSFIIIVISIVLGLSAILYATRTYIAEVDKNSTLLISFSDGLPQRPMTPSTPSNTPKNNTTTSNTSNTKNEGVLGNHSVTPAATANYTVSYTNTGFSPQKMTIRSGETVRFLNTTSGKSLWVTAASAPPNFSLSEFNQGKSVGKNGSYFYTFNKKGSYVYYNNNYKPDVGLITVQ